MSELPQGWIETHVGDVADISSGFGFPERFQGKATGDFPFAKVRDISYAHRNHRGRLATADNYVTHTDLLDLKARPAPAGSVAFAKIGEALRLNRRVLLEQDTILDNNCMAVTGDRRAIETEYLYQFLTTVDLSPFAVATTVPSVRRGDVEGIALPLPPLPEQRRIVAKIDSLTGKSRRARDHLDHIPRLVEKYKQAVLAAAFRGDLTREWRASHTPPDADWETIELGQIADVGTGATPKRGTSRYYDGGTIPWVTSGAVNDEIVRGSEECITAAALRETNCQLYPVGTLLLAMYGEGKTRGKVAVLGMEAATNQALAAIVVHRNSPAERDFVHWYLRSQYLELREQAAGGVQPNLNLGIVKRTLLPLPPQIEQREIVQRLEAAFAWIDRLTAEVTSARRLIDRLDQAVLAKAFRGELVPQDPEDEPASMLLDRIRAERGAAPKTRRGRRPAA
ncbi:restriction endonuclease subunit S [Shinella zoogloeoides]|uniref:restriction endonuclease subunit S n=1 Tax=Shinella zoogloeoides TaxID=352475 RepID=UPI000E64C42C|nr:restriction endonuclease subunit S [Shinella zoogloeoides]